MTHLELTTSIGVGGFERLTAEQQADAIGWLMAEGKIGRPAKAKPVDAHKARMERLKKKGIVP